MHETSPIHLLLRNARIAAKLNQRDLALQVGCTQSQISMMEAGRATALSKENIGKIAKVLGVELPEESAAALPIVTSMGVAFCPNFQCPTNYPYFVGGQLFFLPLGSCGCGEHCLFCGELLERKCPNCGAVVTRAGGCCASCGSGLLAMPDGFTGDVASWAATQQAAISALAGLSRFKEQG